MKRFLISGICSLIALSFLASCGKAVSGCTDTTALNYYSSATVNDGSCIYGGNVMFWTNSLSTHGGSITVTLDNGQSTTITLQLSAPDPCGTAVGGDILKVADGTHTYTWKDNFSRTGSGSFVISTDACTTQPIN